MNRITHIFLAALMLAAAACSDADQFRVNGTIEGKPTQNLRILYYSDGAYRTGITAVREGEFEFFAKSTQPAILEITDYEYRPLARLWVQNGTNYTVTIDPAKPYSTHIEGGDVNRRWTDFLRANGDSIAAGRSNSVVSRYIADHPDDVLSAILFTCYYTAADPLDADSIIGLISPQARPASLLDSYTTLSQRLISENAHSAIDSIGYLTRADTLSTTATDEAPYTLIALTKATPFRADSLVPALRKLLANKRVAVVDIGVEPDTLDWKRATAADSAYRHKNWHQGWVAAGIAAPAPARLGIPRTPYFIVCDSTGAQLLRTPHLAHALTLLTSLTHK